MWNEGEARIDRARCPCEGAMQKSREVGGARKPLQNLRENVRLAGRVELQDKPRTTAELFRRALCLPISEHDLSDDTNQ